VSRELARLHRPEHVEEFCDMVAVRAQLRPEEVGLLARYGQGVRSEVGLSYDDLAALVGCSTKTVARILNARFQHPPVGFLYRFAAIVGFDEDQLQRLLLLASLICGEAARECEGAWVRPLFAARGSSAA
jgi:hypothetical protein